MGSDAPVEEKEEISFRKSPGAFVKNAIKSVAHFIWNPKEKTLINRTFLSWGYLGMMYFAFYTILGLFGWALVAILSAVVLSHGQLPVYSQSNSPIANPNGQLNPGMGVRPSIGYTNTPAISNNGDFTQTMNLILQDYDDRLHHTQNCSESSGIVSNLTSACQYDLAKYMTSLNCTSANNYGYSDRSRPCVLVKINNIIGWTPSNVTYPPADEWAGNPACLDSQSILSSLQNNSALNSTSFIYITCSGQSAKDDTLLQSFKFSSPLNDMLPADDPLNNCVAGIPFYYYPYYNQLFYMQPKVAVKVHLVPGSNANIQCSAWNGAIQQNAKGGYGVVQFSVQV